MLMNGRLLITVCYAMVDPARLAKPGNEDSHQVAVMAWAAQHRAQWPCLEWLFHVPNGGSRSKIEGQRFKAMGVRRGVSDLLLLHPSKGFHGLCIEMKHEATGLSDIAKEKMVSDEQRKFLTYQSQQGYACGVCYGYQEAICALEWYLSD